MFITPSFKKSLIVEQFQGNYLKCVIRTAFVTTFFDMTRLYIFMDKVITKF